MGCIRHVENGGLQVTQMVGEPRLGAFLLGEADFLPHWAARRGRLLIGWDQRLDQQI